MQLMLIALCRVGAAAVVALVGGVALRAAATKHTGTESDKSGGRVMIDRNTSVLR
jgi:nitrous oxidase accessory protein NosD